MLEIRSIDVRVMDDTDPDLSWLEDSGPDPSDADCAAYCAARLASYGSDWTAVGVQAVADIVVNGVCQSISSGGLWGIESDSSAEHFAAIRGEEMCRLQDILRDLGFSQGEIAAHLS